jgi:hypothetical protein
VGSKDESKRDGSGGDSLSILRQFILREIETINAYDAMLRQVDSEDVQRMLAHAIYEEKEHVAEGLQLLRRLDPMQDRAMQADHSDHFAPDGPGARALAALRDNQPLPPKAANPPGAAGAPIPPAAVAPRGTAGEAATPPPSRPANRADDLTAPTIGSLRGKPV